MTSLVDLMQTEAPDRVDVVGKRLSGSVAVVYGRTSHLTPAIRFGSQSFGQGTSVVTANGIECEVAGITFYRKPDGTWDYDTYRNVRKLIDYRQAEHTEWEVSYKTEQLIIDALAEQCPGLWERFPGAFQRLGVGSEYADGSSYDAAVKQAENDLRIVRQFAELYRRVEEGTVLVLERGHHDLPDEIRWEHPSHDTMANHDVQKGRGRVVGFVTGANLSEGLLGYVVDRSGTPYKPDTYHGPLLVPLALASHVEDRPRPVATPAGVSRFQNRSET